MVEDITTETATNLNFMLGKEFRRGNTRVQGVYGAELHCSIASNGMKYEYGNSAEDRGASGDPLTIKSGADLGLEIRRPGNRHVVGATVTYLAARTKEWTLMTLSPHTRV